MAQTKHTKAKQPASAAAAAAAPKKFSFKKMPRAESGSGSSWKAGRRRAGKKANAVFSLVAAKYQKGDLAGQLTGAVYFRGVLSQTAVNELTGSEEAPQAASLEDKWERIEARSRHLDAMTDAERDVLFADVAALVEAEGGHSSDALNSMADCEMLEWGMPCGSTPAPSVARPVGVAPARPLTGGRASSASWRVQPICC